MLPCGESCPGLPRFFPEAGQYLRPSVKHAEIKKYYHPDEFKEFAPSDSRWESVGFFSGPLVRSSYHAEDVFDQMMSTSRQ